MIDHIEETKSGSQLPDNQQTIWNRFKNGDKQAYAVLYRSHADFLFRYGRKIIQDRDMIKDGIHDLFVDLWRTRETLSTPPNVRNYLAKSFRNKLLRQTKRSLQVVYKGNELIEGPGHIEYSSETVLIEGQTAAARNQSLIKALKSLTGRQKEIVFLLYYGNLQPQEVADILSVSVRTVYNTVYNALEQLRKEPILLVVIALLTFISDKL